MDQHETNHHAPAAMQASSNHGITNTQSTPNKDTTIILIINRDIAIIILKNSILIKATNIINSPIIVRVKDTIITIASVMGIWTIIKATTMDNTKG